MPTGSVLSEKSLLKDIAKGKWDAATRAKHVNRHNKDSNNNMRLIDRDIFRALQFSGDEVREVYRTLDELKLFDYDTDRDLDAFVRSVSYEVIMRCGCRRRLWPVGTEISVLFSGSLRSVWPRPL